MILYLQKNKLNLKKLLTIKQNVGIIVSVVKFLRDCFKKVIDVGWWICYNNQVVT